MYNNQAKTYKDTKIKTSGPGQLVIMLYDETIKQLGIVLEEFGKEKKDLERIHLAIVKTQSIISELMASLDFSGDNEIAERLHGLYTYFYQKLIECNVSKEVGEIPEIRRMLTELREAWLEISNKSSAVEPMQRGVDIEG